MPTPPFEALTATIVNHLEESLPHSPDDPEPLVRAALRRALAEQSEIASPFGKVSFYDKSKWRLQALLTSRTYDDILFQKTRRNRVEEIFLIHSESQALLSFASRHPSRHVNPRRVKYDLDRLLEDFHKHQSDTFSLPNKNTALVQEGKNCLLISSIKGPPDSTLETDLRYALSQIETQFGNLLHQENPDTLKTLQPHLEACLLIQSPLMKI